MLNAKPVISLKEDRLISRAIKCLESRILNINDYIKNSDDVKAYLRLKFSDQLNETLFAIFMNNNHGILAFEKLFNGTINEAPVYPRVIVKKALDYNASAVILAHNHPSGNCEPSRSDIAITRKINEILDIIDVRLLDHLIVTHSECYSFTENRLI